MKLGVVILAAGSGARFGGDKLACLVGGIPVWKRSYLAFLTHHLIDEVIVVCSSSNFSEVKEAVGEDGVDTVVDGVQVGGKGDARRVERGLVARLDRGHVVLDGAAPPLEARRRPRAAVLAPAALAVGLALFVKLLDPHGRDDARVR